MNKNTENSIKEEELKYKWFISSTGSNTYGTPFSKDLEDYLTEKDFSKIHNGNPTYGTTKELKKSEVVGICRHIMHMRKDYGQDAQQIEVTCSEVSNTTKLKFDTKNKGDKNE